MRLLPSLAVLVLALLAARIASSGTRINAVSYHIGTLPQALPGNERIGLNAELLFKGEIVAPEHFAFHENGDIYFGVADGRIMRTRPNSDGSLAPLETVVYTGDALLADRGFPCGTEQSEAVCGRPLGMAFAPTGKLIVADCYLGLLEIDADKGTKRVLLREVDGLPLYFANSVAIGKSGTIYLTDSSQRWRRRDFIYEVLESQSTGRVIRFDPASGEAKVLVTNLAFANGILVDPREEKYLIINELGRSRLFRLDLTSVASIPTPIDAQFAASPRAPSSALSVLISNLPGVPDNLAWESSDPSSGLFWVGCGTKRTQPFSLSDALEGLPLVRETLVRLLPKQLFLSMVPRVGLLLRLQVSEDTRSAQLVETMQDSTGKFPLLTGGYEHRGFLYLGAISHEVDFVARIPWTQANRTDTSYRLKQY